MIQWRTIPASESYPGMTIGTLDGRTVQTACTGPEAQAEITACLTQPPGQYHAQKAAEAGAMREGRDAADQD